MTSDAADARFFPLGALPPDHEIAFDTDRLVLARVQRARDDDAVTKLGEVIGDADLAAEQKVFIDLGCSSHNAMWEKNHLLLFKASLEWLSSGTVNGQKSGELKMGY